MAAAVDIRQPLIPWTGYIVPFDAQDEQVKGQGWGNRYKVRIVGDYSEKDTIEDEEVRWCIALVNITDGSGGGGRFRSSRIVQGDMVFGVYLGGEDGQPMILGVFPRTSYVQSNFGNKLGSMDGFWKGIQPAVVGQNQIGEQGGCPSPVCSTTGSIGSRKDASNETTLGKLGEMGVSNNEGELPTEGENKMNNIPKPLTEKGADIVEQSKTEPKQTVAERRAARAKMEEEMEKVKNENNGIITEDQYDQIYEKHLGRNKATVAIETVAKNNDITPERVTEIISNSDGNPGNNEQQQELKYQVAKAEEDNKKIEKERMDKILEQEEKKWIPDLDEEPGFKGNAWDAAPPPKTINGQPNPEYFEYREWLGEGFDTF